MTVIDDDLDLEDGELVPLTADDRLGNWFLAQKADGRRAWLQEQPEDVIDAFTESLGDRIDPMGTRVYRRLGYEPICKPRVLAALDAGYMSPMEAAAAGNTLPPRCGRCPQEVFDASIEFDVFFGGAAGPGKTKAMLMLAIRCAHRWKGFRALFLRETYDELDENVFPELRKIDYASEVGGVWNAGRKELVFHGSSAVRFRYLGNLEHIGRRQGGSYQLLCLDERTQLPPGTADGLRDRLRSVDNIPVVGIRSTGNPGGRAHGELKDKYIDATDHGAKVLTVPIPGPGGRSYERRFVPAKATDNPYLDDAYYAVTLGGIEDPVRRRAMAEGDWDIFAGQFFGEWRHARHVVPRDAVELVKGWARYSGIDYGYAAPWCVLTGARDNDGRLWMYREIYKTLVGERDQARLVLEDERAAGDRDVKRFADPSMWAKASDAKPIATTYRDAGVPLVEANNDRVSGWARVHTYFADAPACLYHREQGWESCPLVHVLEGTCPNFVRTIPVLPFDRHKVEDLDTDAEDHAADAFRYLVMGVRAPVKRKLFGQQLAEMGVR